MRKTEPYKLFNIDVFLSERNASDIFALEEYYKQNTDKYQDHYFQIEIVYKKIIDSLSYYIGTCNFIKRYKLKRKLNIIYFLRNLGFNETMEMADIIDKLEGTDKKKVQKKGKPLVEKLVKD